MLNHYVNYQMTAGVGVRMEEEIKAKETEVLRCTSCNVHIQAKGNFVKFMCPACNKQLIVRCKNCKDASVLYKCKNCGFEGP